MLTFEVDRVRKNGPEGPESSPWVLDSLKKRGSLAFQA
jgi:hypothetical protein